MGDGFIRSMLKLWQLWLPVALSASDDFEIWDPVPFRAGRAGGGEAVVERRRVLAEKEAQLIQAMVVESLKSVSLERFGWFHL